MVNVLFLTLLALLAIHIQTQGTVENAVHTTLRQELMVVPLEQKSMLVGMKRRLRQDQL